MRLPRDVARAILQSVVFTPEQIEQYGNWAQIPRDVALRLSATIQANAVTELTKYAEEIGYCYSYYGGGGSTLLHYKLPQEPIKLSFDPHAPIPQGLKKDARFDAIHVRKIFKNKVARALWLGIRPGYITSQYFIPDIECMASLLWKYHRNQPACWHQLFSILARGRDGIFRGSLGTETHVREMAILLLPYVRGEKEFKWVVEKPA